jgi:hypothetical protein
VPAHSAHDHHHGGGPNLTTEQTRRLLAVIIGLVAAVAVVGLVVLWPDGERPELGPELGLAPNLVDADVTGADQVPCAGTAEEAGIRCVEVEILVTSGDTKGDTATTSATPRWPGSSRCS